MGRRLLIAFACMLSAFFGSICAYAQSATARAGSLVYAHSSIGTTAGDAISAASVTPTLIGWKVCADGANTSYVAFSNAADPDTDGVRVAAGTCFECPACSTKSLKDLNAKGGAASQAYSVIQFKQ